MVLMQNVVEEEFTLTVCAKYNFDSLKKFVIFAVILYIPWWFSSTNSADAPMQDWLLATKISKCAEIDPKCKDSSLKSLVNHFWYFTPELLPLCLFSPNVKTDLKEKIAKMILSKKDEVSTFCFRFYKNT